MDDLLTRTYFRDCHISDYMDDPIGDPELLECLSRLFEALEDCQVLAHSIIKRKKTTRTLKIQECLTEAQELIEKEL